MKITGIEFVGNKKPLKFGTPLRFCFEEPDVRPILSHGFSLFRVHTDAGITGVAPTITPNVDPMVREFVIGRSPECVTELFDRFMCARGLSMGRMPCSGLEIALWDILAKAKGVPLYRMFGAVRDRVPAYCSLVQLHSSERLVEIAEQVIEEGFKALKIRFHRPDPREDLATAQALRAAVGDRIEIIVDANQSNVSLSYPFWSYETALWMAKELEALDILWLEEPLPRHEEDALARLCGEVEIPIAGGEHHETWELFRNAIQRDVFDIVQPDACLGNVGITGLRRLAPLAAARGKGFAPHVLFWGNHALYLAATLQVLGSVANEGWLEYIHDPPTVTPANQQQIARNPLVVGKDGCVPVPEGPGLGVELDEDFISEYRL